MSNVNESIKRETYEGIVPVLSGERMYSFKDIALIATGYGVASWCYTQGAFISSIVPVNLALIAQIFSFLAAGVVTILTVTIACRFGIDLWVYQRAVFGHKFIAAICIIAILGVWGFYATNAQMFSSSCTYLAESIVGAETFLNDIPWFLAIVCCLIGLFIALKGPYMVKIATYIMVPAIIGVGIIMLIKILSTASFSELMKIEPLYVDSYSSLKVGFMVAGELGFGFAFTWYTALGTFARIGNSERASVWGYNIGYIGAVNLFSCIGIVGGCLMAGLGSYSADPTDWMLTIGGPVWGIISLISVAFANITTQALGCYALCLATKIVCPSWNYKIIAIAYTAYCCFLVCYDDIWTIYPLINAIGACVAAPAIGMILADFFLVRKKKLDMRSLFRISNKDAYNYTGGFNIVAVVCMAVGIIVYWLLYDPVLYYPRNDNPIFLICGASIPSFIVSAGLYVGASKVPSIKQYMIRDKI